MAEGQGHQTLVPLLLAFCSLLFCFWKAKGKDVCVCGVVVEDGVADESRTCSVHLIPLTADIVNTQ